jgi:hypothetical protein
MKMEIRKMEQLDMIHGMTFYIESDRDRTLNEDSIKTSLKIMQEETGANTTMISFATWMNTAHSESFDWHQDTPDDDLLRHVISYAKEVLGLRVFLKPMINCHDGQWRAYISFLDHGSGTEGTWQNWFACYGDYMNYYADLAEETGCELLMVGCELVMSEHCESLWRTLIANVRRHYHGLISYNTDKYQEEWVNWWDAVDVISSSGYYPLGTWSENLQRIKETVEKFQKPFFFAECGCPSRHGSSSLPNDWTKQGALDLEEQKDYFEDMLSALSEADWVRGCVIWSWNADDVYYASENDSYSVYHKPAAKVLKQHWD